MKMRYEVHDVDQSAEIITLKAELTQCRELSELRLQSEQKLIAERDRLYEDNVMLEDMCKGIHLLIAERDKLRAALERIATGHHAEPVQDIARRALEGK